MTTKSLLIAATLTLTSLAVAGTKSYEFTLGGPTQFGNTELKAGEYKMKVDGTQAVIHDEHTGKSITVNVKVEHAGRKFDQTTVQSANKDGKDRVVEIHLGGSDTKLEVAE
jgi:hypothetical protein